MNKVKHVWFAVEGRTPQVGEVVYAQGRMTVATVGRMAVGQCRFVTLPSMGSLACVAVFPEIVLELQADGKMWLPLPKK